MDERTVFQTYLRTRGQKMTGARETVLEAFMGLERHVTAEDILSAARRLDTGIGQATVFRTIRLLEDAGIAREARPEDGARRWEHAYRHRHHDHLVCLGCGAVVEFHDAAVEKAQDEIYRRYGFTPADHTLELKGYCSGCAPGTVSQERRDQVKNTNPKSTSEAHEK
jgi:Fur family ferric uptake transcriptional regulator